jgi:stalled ribosome alternative rescue factor ArfA
LQKLRKKGKGGYSNKRKVAIWWNAYYLLS